MKMKTIFLTVLLTTLVAAGLPAASLNQTMASINADAKKEGGPAKVLQSISASTKVPVATLEKQKAKNANLTYGDLFAANTIAKASGKSFDEIAAMKAKGQSWDKISESLGVSLDGKKKTNAPQPNAKASPTPPTKSLFQEQKDRYK